MNQEMVFEYKGYHSKATWSEEDQVWYGKLDNCTDLITYESESQKWLEASFQDAVNCYIDFCADRGTQPKYA